MSHGQHLASWHGGVQNNIATISIQHQLTSANALECCGPVLRVNIYFPFHVPGIWKSCYMVRFLFSCVYTSTASTSTATYETCSAQALVVTFIEVGYAYL